MACNTCYGFEVARDDVCCSTVGHGTKHVVLVDG